MERKRRCPVCGTEFMTKKPNKKYCSFSCRDVGSRVSRMKWNDNNPDYITKYMRDYRKKLKEQKET